MALKGIIEVWGLAPDQLRSAKLRRLCQFWRELTAVRRLPYRAEFSPEQLPFIIGQVSMIDVLGEPAGFHFRLVGTKIEDRGRRGDHGKILDQIEPAAYRALLTKAYETVVAGAEPVVQRLEFKEAPGRIWYERVVLPFTLGGERVEGLLEGIDWPLSMNQDLAEFDPANPS